MALDDLYDVIIAHAAAVIRQNHVMCRLVDRNIAAELEAYGGTVNVSVTQPKTTTPVAPGPTPPGGDRSAPKTVPVTLDHWEDCSFSLTDRDVTSMSTAAEFIPNELQEASIAVANRVDETIFANYTGVYGFAGQPGVTPFATSTQEAQEVSLRLIEQGVPMNSVKHLALSPTTYTNAIGLESLQHADKYGDSAIIKTGQIPFALGYSWHACQNSPQHVTGAAGVALVAGAGQMGETLIADGFTTIPTPGDVFTLAGSTQTYAVIAASPLAGTQSMLSIAPAITIPPPDNALLSFKASHRVSLGFHPSAFAFACRVAAGVTIPDRGPVVRTFVDDGPNGSGLIFTLRVNPEHYQTSFYLSCMWGTRLVDARKAVRLAG